MSYLAFEKCMTTFIYYLTIGLLAFDWVDDPYFGYRDISSGQPAISSYSSDQEHLALPDAPILPILDSILHELTLNRLETIPIAFVERLRPIYVFMSIRR
jgi:hypothetical protein